MATFSACAPQLISLLLRACNLCPASVAALSGLLGEDHSPLLRCLALGDNPGIGDDGVAVLARGLLAAPRTRLVALDLHAVGKGDRGVAALTDVIRAGRLDQLMYLALGGNDAVTDRGVSMLAQAVEDSRQRTLSSQSARDCFNK